MWMDSATANLRVNNSEILTGSASGVVLYQTPQAPTASQTFDGNGSPQIATTAYVKTATTWWDGSAKFVSNAAPVAGINDGGSNNGDFWFQYAE